MNIWNRMKWAEIKIKCPLDIKDLVYDAEEIYNNLRIYDDENIEEARARLIFIRSKLHAVISRMLGMIHTKRILEEKGDEIIFYRIQENLGRMLGIIDEAYKIKILSAVRKIEKNVQ